MKRLALLFAAGIAAARAQSTISGTEKFAHGANFGWVNFRPSTADGLRVNETTLSGRAWSANFGWLYCGDGVPHTYANTSASNFGVNLAADGKLTGYAWCPNAGWIVFEQTHGQPRIDLLTGQFHGHAWCPNAGWINLDAAPSALRTTSITIADSDNDSLGDAWEMQQFGNLSTANATSNSDSDAASDLDEYRSGTNPRDAADWLQVVSQPLAPAGNSVTLRFTTAPGRVYRIEATTDMQTWSEAGAVIPPDAGKVTETTLSLPAGGRAFFRISAQRPLLP